MQLAEPRERASGEREKGGRAMAGWIRRAPPNWQAKRAFDRPACGPMLTLTMPGRRSRRFNARCAACKSKNAPSPHSDLSK